jgi:hypothetical protein
LTVAKQYPPNAILYRWLYREDDNLVRLIGTDPALDDRARFFRWVNEPGGWERREPWPNGSANTESVDNAIGAASGWPGAVSLRGKAGRPPKDLAEGDKPASVKASVRRVELYEIQRLASTAQQSVSEWVTSAIRDKLARASEGGT